MEILICALLLFLGEGAAVTSTDKIAELFSQIEDDGSHKEQSEVINNDYNSVLCWLETINSVVYRNGTRTTDRQFSVILETPGDLFNTSLDLGGGSPGGTKKSKVLNFTSTYPAGNFTAQVNKTLLCGAGQVIIKEFIRWPGKREKKRIQIDLGSKKMLEMHEKLKTCGDRLNCKLRREYAQTRKSGTPVSQTVDQPRSQTVDQVTPYSETVGQAKSNNCNLLHKININLQVTLEHSVTNISSNKLVERTVLLNGRKGQEFDLTRRHGQKQPSQDDVNRTWERLVRLLAREYFIECCRKIIPFSDLPMSRTNATVSSGEALVLFDEETRAKLAAVQKQAQKCNV